MKSFRIAIALLAAVLVAASASAQKGKAALAGKVADDKGQPILDVAIRAQMVGTTELLAAKTDKKGEFKLKSLANGEWHIEFAKQGLATVQQSFEVKDDKTPAMNITMAPPVDPTIAINAELQKAVSFAQGGKFVEARQVCEGVIAKAPTVTQCYGFIARMFAAEGQVAKGVEAAKIAIEKEANNPDNKVLLGDLLLENGQKAEALQLLVTMDVTGVKDPTPFLNAAITLINDKRGEDAAALLTRLEPAFKDSTPEIYYYRGRAYVAANKLAEAKVDFEKFVSVGKPDSKEVADAKKILDQINK